MNKSIKILVLILPVLFLFSCKTTRDIDFDSIKLADKQASKETKILYQRIRVIAKEGIAFGHEDATAYGINWKDNGKQMKSDVKEITGKFPAIHGFDVGHIELDRATNLDTVSFDLMRRHIKKIYRKEGIITFSWHLDNPVTNGDSWDTRAAVPQILKNGEEREKYELWIHRLSNFFKSLKDKEGNYIPVVFRPFHEMNGSWFWWGEGNVSAEDYKNLWRETIVLLKENQVNNLLYAYSPNTVDSIEEFNKYYPGDEFVDILGIDIYNHNGDKAFTENLKQNLKILKNKAQTSNKPYALTESGNNKFGMNAQWWTEALYPGIKNSGIAWVLVWRNDGPDHYFASYKGDVAEEDFKTFEDLKEILFLKEISKINY